MSTVALRQGRALRASSSLKSLGHTFAPHGSVKAQLRAAAEKSGLLPNRAREIWYGRAKRVHAAEIARIEAAIPPDTVEFSLAYVRSVEIRVAALLDELLAVRTQYEARLGGVPADRPPPRSGAAQPSGAAGPGRGGVALDRR